ELSYRTRSHADRGSVDVVVATLSATPERAEQISFSQVYYAASERLLVHRAGPITRLADLVDQKVAIVKDTSAALNLSRLVLGARAYEVGDYGAAVSALQNKE